MTSRWSSGLVSNDTDVPIALARLHGEASAGTRVRLRRDPRLDARRWEDVLEGAGFAPVGDPTTTDVYERVFTLPDTVCGGLRVLVVGLNPSERAAEAGVGFVTPGNRFWPAALAAGLVALDRAPFSAALDDGVGMTDLVKRPTRRASDLRARDYRDGLPRLERLARWLAPRVVCFVGLTGYRTSVRADAVAGLQPELLGGRPVYLMPNTSGLNAHTQLEGFVEHFESVRALSETVRPDPPY